MSYRYLVLLIVLGLRLWELFFSWRRLRESRAEEGAGLAPDPVYPAMVALHAGWFAACLLEVKLAQPIFQSWVALPALFAWIGALGLRLWVIASLGELWNVRLIRREPQPVVVRGPYRFLRHPNYLVVIVEIAVVPLMLGAYWTALLATVANGFVIWKRIAAEEAYLFESPAYREAFQSKKRLVPGVF